MKTLFYTDGEGKHRATLEPENQVEKVMIQAMSLYACDIEATKIPAGPSGDVDALVVTFSEQKVRHA